MHGHHRSGIQSSLSSILSWRRPIRDDPLLQPRPQEIETADGEYLPPASGARRIVEALVTRAVGVWVAGLSATGSVVAEAITVNVPVAEAA
jgi:hypothetical protein